MDDITTARWFAGQAFGVIALTLCMLGFVSKRDDRLLLLLLMGNMAFAFQFAMFSSWVAAAISMLIVLRVYLARRYPRNWSIMLMMLAATVLVAIPTWTALRDVWALAAGVIGTYAMFMCAGIAMRWLLALAASCWIVSNWLIQSYGGILAEVLILVANMVTVARLYRDRINAGSTSIAPGDSG